jgi:hypothetical protein
MHSRPVRPLLPEAVRGPGSVTRQQRRAVAYHEAGHAVAHTLVGDQIELVTIVPAGDYLGQVRLAEVVSRSTGISELMCILAGPAAETIATGYLNPGGASSDLSQMIQLVQGELRDENTWSAIDWVAQALLAKRKLSGDEVKALIEQAARWKNSQRRAIAKLTNRSKLIQ